MRFKDYYDILGVPPGADADVIKTAYRKLARKFHPDVSKEKHAEDKFKDVNEAYEVLKDADKRRAYDDLRARGYRPGQEFQPPPNFGQEYGVDLDEILRGSGAGGGGFGDFFESLFGNARAGGARPHARPRGGARAATQTARVEIDLETAFTGGTQRLGLGARTLDVKIPAGILPGQQIRLRGQADGGGDLMLEIALRPHARFVLEGKDLTVKLPLAPWDAALGSTVEVPTLAGSVQLRVPPGTGSGKRLRLRGRGMPGMPPGDQYVALEVQAPAPASDEQREAYERLATAFGAKASPD